MASQIDIISNALLLIGHNSISSLDPDQGAGATVGAALFDTTLEYMLSITYWRFSMKQQELNKLTATPLNNWQFAYQLPTDMITLYRVDPRANYQIFEDKLFTNISAIAADYSFKPDAVDLPPYFVQAMQYKLAADFAIAITNDTRKNALYEAKYTREVAIAMGADAKNHPPVSIQDQPFTDIRLSGFDFIGGNI
jgi:hypothetical protein